MATVVKSMYALTGKGYERGWWTNCKARYRIYKGARNTKKSYVMCGIEILDKILSDRRRNVLVIRNTLSSHRTSTFNTICLLIELLGISSYFKIKEADLIITYNPTGQVIMFKGMDNPQKLQSIRTKRGYLTDVYIEEAFELKSYDAWRKVDGSIRGELPDGLFHQITFCFNAWNKNHWLYDVFFKGRMEDDLDYLITHAYQDYYDPEFIGDYGKGIYLHTSTYKVNEFRDTNIYDIAMENLRKVAPEIYKVEALGMWGNSTGATYPEFNESCIIPIQEVVQMSFDCIAIGIDTGLSDGEGRVKYSEDVRIRSATTMQMVGITRDFNKLVCIDEFFYSNENELVKKTEPQLMEEIIDTLIEWSNKYYTHRDIMKGIIPIYVDCADIGFRQGLELVAKRRGIFNLKFIASTKIRIQTRVDFIRVLMAWGEFLVSTECPNLIREIKNSNKGEKGEPREDIDDHAINANEYAWASIIKRLKRWATFKEH